MNLRERGQGGQKGAGRGRGEIPKNEIKEINSFFKKQVMNRAGEIY